VSEQVLSTPDVATAKRLMRHLDASEAVEAGILTPMAGTRPVRLFSLKEAEEFLVVYDKDTIDSDGQWATVNYIDPANLARWVEAAFGDTELASRLQEIVATRKAFGFLVPDMKALLAERIAQCEEILAPAEATRE